MMTLAKLTIIVAMLSISLWACKKNSNNNDTTTTTDDKENVQMITTSDQISTDMEQAFDDGYNTEENGVATTEGLVFGPCVTVTLVQNGNMKTLTVDYGTAGCLCNDGKTRKGKLIAMATHFNQINVLRTLATDNYYVDNYHVDGTITRNITNQTDSANRTAEIVENLTVTNPGGTLTFTRTGNMTRIFHYGLPNHPIDNTLTTWGQVNIQRPNGTQISRTVNQSSPLFYKNTCHQIVSGTANITRNNHDISIDFGTGNCDGTASVSNGTNTWTINL